MNKFIFIIFFLFSISDIYSQNNSKYCSFPCNYEKYDFIDDSVVFVKSGIGNFLFLYTNYDDTIKLNKINNQLLNIYKGKRKFRNITINHNSFVSEIGTIYRINNLNNLVLIKRKNKMLIEYTIDNNTTYYILTKKNIINSSYYYIQYIFKYKILKKMSCRLCSDYYNSIRLSFRKEIDKNFPSIKKNNPYYFLLW